MFHAGALCHGRGTLAPVREACRLAIGHDGSDSENVGRTGLDLIAILARRHIGKTKIARASRELPQRTTESRA